MFSITFQILFISITLLGLENTMLKFPDTSMTVGSVYVDSGTSCLVNHRHCVPHTIVPSSTFPNHKHHVILLIFYSSDIFIYPTFYIHLNSTSTRTLTSVCANQLHIVPPWELLNLLSVPINLKRLHTYLHHLLLYCQQTFWNLYHLAVLPSFLWCLNQNWGSLRALSEHVLLSWGLLGHLL